MFLSVIARTLLLSGAGYALWRVWRLADVHPPLIRGTIAGGLFVRAVAGAVLFFISWLELPFARGLQRGGGFWFFGAADGATYFRFASEAASQGPLAILTISDAVHSVLYVQVLAVFVVLFGAVASVAVLLNAAAYLGTALLIAAWARRNGVEAQRAVVPLAAVSFLPSWILWSLQPMKDPFFWFLVVLFAFSFDGVVRAVRRTPFDGRRAARYVLLLLLSSYGLAGIRWYYAIFALSACAIALLAASVTNGEPRMRLARVAIVSVVCILMTQIIVFAAGRSLPPAFHTIFRPFAEPPPSKIERSVPGVIVQARSNFDAGYRTAGTRIHAGSLVSTFENASRGNESAASPDVPTTAIGRLVCGMAAMLLPRAVAQSLGLVSIGGGSGFWWFVEADTVLTAVVLLIVAVIFFRSVRRGEWRDPTVAYLVFISVTIALALAYTISNLGALFRQRGMVVATAVLLAVCVRPRASATPHAVAENVEPRRE